MQIVFSPDNFVLIFQNSNWLTSTYCFIQVLCEWELDGYNRVYNKNPSGLKLKVKGNISPMILNTGPVCDKKNFGSKSDWVLSSIEGLLFNKNNSYLYLHNNILGYYRFLDKTFTPFEDNNVAQATMHQFFYRMLSLSNNTLNWVSSSARLLTQDYYNESESVNDTDYDNINDDDDDDESEEEVVVVLQTGPIQKKNK